MNTVSTTDLLTIAPFLAICITGMFVLVVDVFLPKKWCVPLSLLGIVGAAYLTGKLSSAPAYMGFSGTTTADTFAQLFQYLLLVVCGLSVLLSERYIREKNINHGEYYALLLFSTSGGMLMAASKELILIFIGLEILSISLYVLSGFARTEAKSEEAAMKYFLLGAFSSAFFLYGIAMIYGGTGIANVTPDGIHHPTTLITNIGIGALNSYTMAGLALLLVGLFFKAALVPFHVWTPDVYQGAPTSVTAYMSAAAKMAAFAVMLRLLPVFLTYHNTAFISGGQVQMLHNILWVVAAATMIVGNVVALWQTDVKRLLAYSSIAHAGYLLVGVLANNAMGQSAVLFYLLVYTFMNLGAFGVLMMLTRSGDERTSLRDMQGLGYRQPLAAILMSIFMFSLASVPPAAGFIAKFQLFSAAAQAHLYGLAIIGFLSSVVGAYYYLMVVARMWMMAPSEEQAERHATIQWSSASAVAIGVAAVSTIGLFVFPQYLLGTFNSVSTSPNAGEESPVTALPAPTPAPAASHRYVSSLAAPTVPVVVASITRH